MIPDGIAKASAVTIKAAPNGQAAAAQGSRSRSTCFPISTLVC
jgi:hypothetical protein